MTISSQTREMTATGNGVTTVFPYTFIIPDADYAYLYREEIATEVETLVSTNDYTLSGVGEDDGGNVTYNPGGVPLPATHRLILRRVVDYVQEASISTQSGFNAAVVEQQLDLQVMMIQQLAQGSDTALGETLAAIEVLEGLVDDAEDSMDAAAASATAAATSASDAAASAADAVISAGEAEDSSDSAIAAAATAASSLATLQGSFIGTSVSNITPGVGTKVFATQADKAWYLGQYVRATNDAGTKFMDGTITAYSAGNVTIEVTSNDFYAGTAGTQWNIGPTGSRGSTGASGAGSGDMVGPASSAAGNLPTFVNTGGKLMQDGGVALADLATTVALNAAIDAVKGGAAAAYDTLDEIGDILAAMALYDLVAGAGLTGGGLLTASRTFNVGAGTGITVNANDVAIDPAVVPSLTAQDQTFSGGFRTPVQSPTDPTNASTFTPDPGDGSQQEITNNVAAWTLAPPAQQGSLFLWITNGASAGTITEGGYTLVDGDVFDTTNGSKFLCTIVMSSVGSYLNIRKLV